MKLERLSVGLILLAMALGALAAGLSGLWLLGGLGAAWLAGRSWKAWADGAGLALFAACLGAVALLTRQPFLALASLVAALSGWDLGVFARRMAAAPQVRQRGTLVRRHATRLGALDALGLGLGGLGLAVRVELSFALVFFLALLAIYLLVRAIGAAKERVKDEG